jgi:4-carboxymuconolactone decarboxylase
MGHTGAPRLGPLPPERWDEQVEAALRQGSAALLSARVPDAIATMMHHPRLAGAWLAYNGTLLRDPALGSRLRELMVLRVAWRTGSTYEWLQHVRMATRGDVTLEEVEAVTRGADADGWTPLEADLLAATDQLLDRYRIDDDTWGRLAERLDERQLVEVPYIVGTYTLLAMALNSFGLKPDADLQSVSAPAMPE